MTNFECFSASSLGWNIPKFHTIRHVPQLLIMFGCWENVSMNVNTILNNLMQVNESVFVCFILTTFWWILFQAGEMAHKAHVKEAMLSTNRKDYEIQIMSVHARRNASVHHMRLFAGMQSVLFCTWLSNFWQNCIGSYWLQFNCSQISLQSWKRWQTASNVGLTTKPTSSRSRRQWKPDWDCLGESNINWRTRGRVKPYCWFIV